MGKSTGDKSIPEANDPTRIKKVTIEDIDTPELNSPADVLRPLSWALNTDGLAINYFELAPGESFGYAYHRHHDQEEVFYVQTGTATFKTEIGDVDVEAGEIIRFAPSEFQLGTNQTDDRIEALALGAPRESEEIEHLIHCPQCGERTIQTSEITENQDTLIFRCSDCETETDQFTL